MERTSFIIMILMLFSSCSFHNNSDEFSVNLGKVKQNSKDFYKIENLFAHYPENIPLDSIVSHPCSFSNLPLNEEKYMIEVSYLVLKADIQITDSSELNNYTSFNMGFKGETFCETVNFEALNSGMLPIPDLKDIFDKDLKFSKILFIEAKHGDFWKKKNDCERPECLGKWKNGYSRGIGVYQDSTGWKKMYWVMYW